MAATNLILNYPLTHLSNIRDVFKTREFTFNGTRHQIPTRICDLFKTSGSINVIPTNVGLVFFHPRAECHTFGQFFEFVKDERRVRRSSIMLPNGNDLEIFDSESLKTMRRECNSLLRDDGTRDVKLACVDTIVVFGYDSAFAKYIMYMCDIEFKKLLKNVKPFEMPYKNKTIFVPPYVNYSGEFKMLERRQMKLHSITGVVNFLYYSHLYSGKAPSCDLYSYVNFLNIQDVSLLMLEYMVSSSDDLVKAATHVNFDTARNTELSSYKKIDFMGTRVAYYSRNTPDGLIIENEVHDIYVHTSMIGFHGRMYANKLSALPMQFIVGSSSKVANLVDILARYDLFTQDVITESKVNEGDEFLDSQHQQYQESTQSILSTLPVNATLSQNGIDVLDQGGSVIGEFKNGSYHLTREDGVVKKTSAMHVKDVGSNELDDDKDDDDKVVFK